MRPTAPREPSRPLAGGIYRRGRLAADTSTADRGRDLNTLPSLTPQRRGTPGPGAAGLPAIVSATTSAALHLDTAAQGWPGQLARTSTHGEPDRAQDTKKRTKTAGIVRISVRKNANLLKINVFCGGERTKTLIKLPNTALS